MSVSASRKGYCSALATSLPTVVLPLRRGHQNRFGPGPGRGAAARRPPACPPSSCRCRAHQKRLSTLNHGTSGRYSSVGQPWCVIGPLHTRQSGALPRACNTRVQVLLADAWMQLVLRIHSLRVPILGCCCHAPAHHAHHVDAGAGQQLLHLRRKFLPIT